MANSKVRIGGSGLTVFTFNGQGADGNNIMAYLQTIQDTAPTPVAQAVPVQSITDPTPREIVTARAVGAGTLRLTFYELWNQSIWQTLAADFKDATNLLGVLTAQLGMGQITCAKIIKTPPAKAGGQPGSRTKTYHNCVIVDIDDGETINIGSMVMPKGITIMYTNAD